MKKKATTRRKARPGASKAPKRRRKASVKGTAPAVSGTTKTFAGKRFTKVACGMNKTDAKKRADNTRKSGKLARVVANSAGKGYCVYVRGAK